VDYRVERTKMKKEKTQFNKYACPLNWAMLQAGGN
jgi:hypothetical protein